MTTALGKNFQEIRSIIEKTVKTLNRSSTPTLVAVSKKKPATDIRFLYDNFNHREFGENYVQELVEKNELLKTDCPEIRFHFIGHLQSNKVKQLKSVSNLSCVETVDSIKLARKLNELMERKIDVFIQINTSEEEAKSGLSFESQKDDILKLIEFIVNDCNEKLNFKGLMTIGGVDESEKSFETLVECKKFCVQSLDFLNDDDVKLSMGMSSDFEKAIEYGSDFIRVGSRIFGERI